jgi:phage terminase large subunit GpA-like protein
MLARGVWIADNPGAQGGKVRGFHLNGLYSPLGWLSWRTIAVEWHQAMQAVTRGDLSLLRVFVNTRLAETFEEQGDKANVHELRKRAEDFPLRVVQWGMFVCTMGVDVQRDRLEVFLWAWGRGFESQLVDRLVIYGDPFIGEGEEGSPWNALTEYRRRDIAHASGQTVPLMACFIDAGDGHTTQPVYFYTRTHQREHVHAIKGASVAGKMILGKPTQQEVNWRGVKIKKGVKLWPIGTDTAKSVFYGRLRLTKSGPGYVHLTKQMPGEVFEQLTAERLVTRYVKGRPKLEWVNPPGKRNEALDGAVYALAAAHYAGIDRWTETEWKRREESLQPPPAEDAPPKPTVQRSPLLGGRISLDGMARFNGAARR